MGPAESAAGVAGDTAVAAGLSTAWCACWNGRHWRGAATSGSSRPGRTGAGSRHRPGRGGVRPRAEPRFGNRAVLDGLDLDITPGEFVALIGHSGSGKSTLLRALAGLDREVTGQLHVTGPVPVAFQEPRLVPWKKVLDNVALGLRVADPQAAARGGLEEVGLAERAAAWPVTLSGGEADQAWRRCDEPTPVRSVTGRARPSAASPRSATPARSGPW
jgi:ABC transporter